MQLDCDFLGNEEENMREQKADIIQMHWIWYKSGPHSNT